MEIVIVIIVILLLFLLCLLFIHGADDKSREELGDEEQMEALTIAKWKGKSDSTAASMDCRDVQK